jgi:hypothetical protein
MARCKALTKAGDQCRNNAIPGTKFCYVSSHGDIPKPLGKRAANFIRNNWLSLTLGAVSLAATGLGLSWEDHARKLAATSGVISSSVQTAPMSVSVGSAEFVMLSKDGVVFDDGKIPLLSIRLVDGRLLVTAEVRDEKGAVIAEMKDNEWKHQQPPIIFDRNYTRDVLEIRDITGKVALQVANLRSTVDVAAIFHCANGWTYMAGPIGGVGSALELRRPREPLEYDIPPICDYPSDLHFGSCPGIERLRQMTSQLHAIYPLHFPVHLCMDARN